MRANLAELMHQRVAAEDGPVAHLDVARKRRVIHQDRVVADTGVMADVHIRHDEIVVANRRFRPVLHRATVNRHILANDVVVTNHQVGGLIAVFEIRGRLANRRELVDVVTRAYPRGTFDHHMRFYLAARANLDAGTYQRPGANLNVVGNGG